MPFVVNETQICTCGHILAYHQHRSSDPLLNGCLKPGCKCKEFKLDFEATDKKENAEPKKPQPRHNFNS